MQSKQSLATAPELEANRCKERHRVNGIKFIPLPLSNSSNPRVISQNAIRKSTHQATIAVLCLLSCNALSCHHCYSHPPIPCHTERELQLCTLSSFPISMRVSRQKCINALRKHRLSMDQPRKCKMLQRLFIPHFLTVHVHQVIASRHNHHHLLLVVKEPMSSRITGRSISKLLLGMSLPPGVLGLATLTRPPRCGLAGPSSSSALLDESSS